MIRATSLYEPIIWSTATSASADAALYSDVESVTTQYAELFCPRRELPPIPVAYDRVVTDNGGMNGVISNEPHSISQISSAVASTSYSGLTLSTREPPPVPSVYAKLKKPNYYNINNADNGAASGTVCDDFTISSTISPSTVDATLYSGLTPSTREPPPVPCTYDKLTKHGYYNIINADNGAASGTVCKCPHSDSEISSNIGASTADATSYSGLEASTREPLHAPIYEELNRHSYYNTRTDN